MRDENPVKSEKKTEESWREDQEYNSEKDFIFQTEEQGKRVNFVFPLQKSLFKKRYLKRGSKIFEILLEIRFFKVLIDSK